MTLSILEAGTGDPVIYVHGRVTTSNIFPKYLDTYSPAYRGITTDTEIFVANAIRSKLPPAPTSRNS